MIWDKNPHWFAGFYVCFSTLISALTDDFSQFFSQTNAVIFCFFSPFFNINKNI